MIDPTAAALPRWRGQRAFFEIWFLVVFDESGRAYWLRYTTFSSLRAGARATVWAAAFEPATVVGRPAPPPFAGKSIHAIDAYAARSQAPFEVRIGDNLLRLDAARGEVKHERGRFAWELELELGPAPAHRMPAITTHLPTSTKGIPLAFDVRARGQITLGDGPPRAVVGRALMMHLWGTRRVDQLAWIAALGSRPDPAAQLEVTSVRPIAEVAGLRPPALTTLALERAGVSVARTTLAAALAHRIAQPRPGLIVARSHTPTRRVQVRAFAELASFVGYQYRDPAGHDLHVAQCDVATAVVEEYERAHPLAQWRPTRQTTFEQAALELHRRRPIEGVATIGWDERCAAQPAARRAAPTAASGERAAWPALRSIVALGLTYRGHIAETGGDPSRPAAPIAFEKDVRSLLPRGEVVSIPSSAEMLAALEAIEPGIAAELRSRYGFLPALMDYEVEIGVAVLDRARLGFFLANDLTARSCQILGEGRPDMLAYWAVAKSFPGFCPVSDTLWLPEGGHRRIPELTLTTRIDGRERQRASTSELAFDLDTVLAIAERTLGRPLAEGDAILTGTPAGVALRVSPLKKRLGDWLFDRFGKLDRAFGMALDQRRFAGAGDVIEVDGGPLGSRRVTLVPALLAGASRAS